MRQRLCGRWLATVLAILVMVGSSSRPCFAHVGAGAVRDPVCGMPLEHPDPGLSVTYEGRRYFFCSRSCRDAFAFDPAKYAHAPLPALMAGVPLGLFTTGVAAVLLASFVAMELLARGRQGAGAGPGNRSRRLGRRNLLSWQPLRRAAGSRPFQFLLQLPFVVALVAIMVSGAFGNPDPRHNLATVLTWTVWWAGLLFVVLLFGNAWCLVCPWDALASWLSRGSLWKRRPDREVATLGLSWPRSLRNTYPALVLLLLLTWLELGFGVTHSPAATAALGGLMLLLAVAGAFVFERKAFCRYACPVGRMCGLYALFAPVALRVESAEGCRECRPARCVGGSERGYPCPTWVHPVALRGEAYCTMCMECVKSCPHDNIALELRPFGTGLLPGVRVPRDEGWLAGALLAVVIFHGLTMTPRWKALCVAAGRLTGAPDAVVFSLGMALGVALPLALVAAVSVTSRWLAGGGASSASAGSLFAAHCITLLPVALFYHLAHNTMHFFMEVQWLAVVLSDPLGLGWDLFGTAGASPGPLLSMPAVWGLQVSAIIVGHLYSLTAAHRLGRNLFPDARRRVRSMLPVLLLMVVLSTVSLWLVAQPMVLRTSF